MTIDTELEFLKKVISKLLVKEIRKDFNDIEESLTLPKGSLRKAITPKDRDSTVQFCLRILLYYIILRKAKDLQAPLFGMPVASYNETFKYRPQITLYFKEDYSDVEVEYAPLRSQISIRLMNETETSLTISELRNMGNRIKSIFGTGSRYFMKRGKVCCSYFDKPNGLQLKLFVLNDNEGKRIITDVCSVINKAPSWEYLNISNNDNPSQSYPIIPENKTILGKITRMPRKRPVGTLYFSHATIAVYGLDKPITIYSVNQISGVDYLIT